MLGGIGWQQLLILLVIVVLIFGTKKLKGLGNDLGGAVKGFRKAMAEEEKPADQLEKKEDANFAEAISEEEKKKDKTES